MSARDNHGRGPAPALAPLTDRVNSEPPIINGMAASEASYIGLLSFAVSFFIGGIISYVSGYWYILPIACIVLPLTAIWYVSLYLQQVKRNRPEGFYAHQIHLKMASHNLIKSKYVTHDGYMQLGCKYRMGTIHPAKPSSDK